MQDQRYEFRIDRKLKDRFHDQVKRKTRGMMKPPLILRAMILDYVRGTYDPFTKGKKS